MLEEARWDSFSPAVRGVGLDKKDHMKEEIVAEG